MFQKFTLLSFSLLSFFATFSQDCNFTISGNVTDIHDTTPLYGAYVEFKNLNKGTFTNEFGYYEIKDVCSGVFYIKVSHQSCESKSKKIDITSNQTLNFKLEHHLEELNEVLLTGNLYKNDFSSSIFNQIKSEELENYSNASLGDALKTISGVSSLHTGSSIVKPIIQGLHSSRVLIISNNVRLHDQQWGEDHAPNLDINAASNITVIKGASALKYGGDAIGGVIVVESQKAPIKDTIIGKTILTGATNGRGGTLSSSLIKAYSSGLNFSIHGSLKRLGDMKAPNYQLTNTGQQENNINLGVGVNKIEYGFNLSYQLTNSEIGLLRSSHIGNSRDLANAINRQTPFFVENFSYSINSPKQEITHQILKLNAFKKINNVGEVDVQYSFQHNDRKEFDIRRGGRDNTASMDMNLMTHTMLAQLEWTEPEYLNSNIGIEFNSQLNFPNPNTGVRRFIPDYQLFNSAVFFTTEYTINDNWKVDAGVRYDYSNINAKKFYQISRWEGLNYNQLFPQFEVEEAPGRQILTNPKFDYHNFSGTSGISHAFNNGYKLVINLSSASRAPNPAELFSDGLHHSLAAVELGDLRFKKEQSFKAGLSFQGNVNKLNFNIQPFYNYIHNFILLEPTGLSESVIRGSFPVWTYRQTDTRLYGIDINANYTFQNFSLRSDMAYVNGQDLKEDMPLILMPPFNLATTITYKKEEWKNFNISLNSLFVSKQNRFPNNNFVVDLLNTTTGELEETVIDISSTPDSYHLLNLSTGVEIEYGSKKLSINLFINNLLNTTYKDYLNRLRYYADEVGTNAMLQLKLNY